MLAQASIAQKLAVRTTSRAIDTQLSLRHGAPGQRLSRNHALFSDDQVHAQGFEFLREGDEVASVWKAL